jgi:hypothetical protein
VSLGSAQPGLPGSARLDDRGLVIDASFDTALCRAETTLASE